MTLSKTVPVLCALLLISGCNTMPNNASEFATPTAVNEMIQAALEKQRAGADEKSIALSLAADPDVNRRANAVQKKQGKGTPISFKIVQLKDDSLLLSADLESLNQDLQGNLGKTYLDHDDYVLTPGQFKFVDFTPIDEQCRYIGVIAAYHNTARATWKQVIRLDAQGMRQPLYIRLKRQEVILKDEG